MQLFVKQILPISVITKVRPCARSSSRKGVPRGTSGAGGTGSATGSSGQERAQQLRLRSASPFDPARHPEGTPARAPAPDGPPLAVSEQSQPQRCKSTAAAATTTAAATTISAAAASTTAQPSLHPDV